MLKSKKEICPRCSESFDIEPELESFFCMHCGQYIARPKQIFEHQETMVNDEHHYNKEIPNNLPTGIGPWGALTKIVKYLIIGFIILVILVRASN